ncbi:MAG: NADH-quinone oxidoreductase subunit J [Verrucomicrobia bacterium]|nr:NADH-quinone oxidoreductase subunit J [Verrucomicrobiota bacterium]
MVLSGLLVVLHRNPVTSAMFLVLSFFFMAGLFVLLEAYFIAVIQVLVYAGAVMVLFLFVVMLLDIKAERQRRLKLFTFVGGVAVAGALGWKLMQVIGAVPAGAGKAAVGTTEEVGKLLFTQYLLPFEVTSVLLLVAMVGVVVLSRRERS